MEALKIIVTGEHENLESRWPTRVANREVKWVQLPVLRFERLAVDPARLKSLVASPVDWLIFCSSRAVRFWSELLLEQGLDFPLETQVACIGERTAEVAGQDGFTPDFYPTEPGTETFLEEFAHLLSNRTEKPRIFIPAAEGGRRTLPSGLRALGCEVETVALYRSLPREDLDGEVSAEELSRADLILFTSPSSVDAFLKHFSLPPAEKVASIGHFTADRLRAKGIANPKLLPEGDFGRIGEILK